MVNGIGKILDVHVDGETLERLEWYARERDTYGPNARTVEELAEAAVAEAALRADTRTEAELLEARRRETMKTHLHRDTRHTWCGRTLAGTKIKTTAARDDADCLSCLRADAAEQRKEDAASK